MKDISNILKSDFLDEEYAHAYTEDFCVDRIASQIHTIRKQRGLSQEELSSLSGIAQESISKYESGDFASITMKTLLKLSRAFDVSLSIKFDSFSNAINDITSIDENSLKVTTRIEDLNKSFIKTLQNQPTLTIKNKSSSYTNFYREYSNLACKTNIASTTETLQPTYKAAA